ncbi:hypothetical protein IE00_13925 [Paracoccus sp. SM22M-07]|nr:hypothetical protein IE00_13925 [Paracoccus sp. SM22M-07]
MIVIEKFPSFSMGQNMSSKNGALEGQENMTIIDEKILELLFKDKEGGDGKDQAVNPITKWILAAFPAQPSQAGAFAAKGSS